jgi:hypothetical protein
MQDPSNTATPAVSECDAAGGGVDFDSKPAATLRPKAAGQGEPVSQVCGLEGPNNPVVQDDSSGGVGLNSGSSSGSVGGLVRQQHSMPSVVWDNVPPINATSSGRVEPKEMPKQAWFVGTRMVAGTLRLSLPASNAHKNDSSRGALVEQQHAST